MMINLPNAVSQQLHRAAVSYAASPGIKGLQPDFVLDTPSAGRVIIETKDWAPTRENQQRAIEQAKKFKETTGADEAYIVLEKMDEDRSMEGLVSLDQLETVLARYMSGKGTGKPGISPAEFTQKSVNRIFAAMPFSQEFDDVFFVAMAPAADAVDASCIRLDEEHYHGEVMETFRTQIRESMAVIADVTDANPNVLYEVGYAHALNKPTIHITSGSLEKLPFNVASYRTYEYSKGQTYRLKEPLIKALQEIINER